MDSIKNFILDNIRYIISGILLILIIVILVQCTGKEKKEDTQENTDQVVAAQDQEQPQEEPNDLQQDAYPEVNALVQSYFDARANGDVDALRATVSELDDEEADSVTKMSQHIESYNNITCYTKRGLAENSYVVYVCYDIKFQNVDTMAPSLNMLYVCTAEDGSLYINNGTWDADTESAISELNAGADVQALVSQGEDAYSAALAQDEKLSNLASTIQSASTSAEESSEEASSEEEQQTEGEAEAEQPAEDTSAGQETVYAKETVNVRSQADENSDRVGQIARGDSAVRISEDENGWSQISYNNATAYVKSEFLTTNPDEVTAAAATASEAPDSGSARIVETAKMRSGEDTSSELIATLYEGTQIEVLEKLSSGRIKIKYDGKTGYVNSECVGK